MWWPNGRHWSRRIGHAQVCVWVGRWEWDVRRVTHHHLDRAYPRRITRSSVGYRMACGWLQFVVWWRWFEVDFRGAA